MTQLNYFQRNALNRLGNVICPANGEFPAFSDLDCVHHAHIVLDELPEQDLSDLLMLLTVLWFLPSPVLRIFLNVVEKLKDLNGEIGALMRMLNFGLRGVAFSLYYSGMTGPQAKVTKTPVNVVGFEVNVR